MKIEEFIEKFADVLDDTDISELTFETEFKSLDEWSSLTALSIIAMIDEEYDITLKGSELRSANTIKDLYELVLSKTN